MGSAEVSITRDDRAITRLAMSHDASHFLLTPTEVVTPSTVEDVAQLMREAVQARKPMTFRAGGTSLCGQAVSDSTLVDTRRNFRDLEVLDDGMRVRVGPGVTLARVNAHLARYGRRLGPDPTSALACTIGGILANNSSGMLAGLKQSAYHTLDSMVFVLPSGRVIDTADPSADITLRLEETELCGGLMMLRKRLRDNSDAVAEIRRLFAMKNTMGYGINALIDFHRPVDIVSHLLIGSEGTLGFIAEATLRTVPLARHSAAALALFPDLTSAAAAAPLLVAEGFEAVELMDVASLRVVRRQPGAPAMLRNRDLTTEAALLIELHETDEEALQRRLVAATGILATLDVIDSVAMTSDAKQRNALVELRRGLYALVAGTRASGTTTLLEDIAVPVDRFEEMCVALDELFRKHGYGVLNVPLFGHARDGNIHFLLSERFDEPEGLLRFRKFTRDLVRQVLRRGGVLKAEHGTGRAMAPFVRDQYGDDLFQVMRAIKFLFDPRGVLNPGVIISNDPDEHLLNLKLMPRIEQEVDNCIECGFCEGGCPSRDLTLTPRQRIVLRREIAARRDDHDLLKQIAESYEYEAVETCAVDGMCAVACPLGIDTGTLVRRQRTEDVSSLEQVAWTQAARTWGLVTRMGSAALTLAKSAAPLADRATDLGRRRFGDDTVPSYDRRLPRGAGIRRKPRRRDRRDRGVAAYFPSCLQTMFGTSGEGVFAAFRELCLRAEVRVTMLDAEDLCCGAPWRAKGVQEGYELMRRKVHAQIVMPDQLPIVMDASSCTQSLAELARHWKIPVLDVVEFVADELLPHLELTAPIESIALHPTCSSTKIGINEDLMDIARFLSDDVTVPASWSCCGFAGDRGLLHPELTASATAEMAREINEREYAAYASVNRTCEIGMSRATGHGYRHIVELLEEATRPR
ncbi:FAD-binding and (Fe-S)-binding domain-containing protein [Tessaracoccus aquimaris]|uniref:FAD-binding and (Fe-S)-binding domain-containing protein n=1 Tax=Tessaracoccus aquimaris TaxID=1332264 RepID=UPI000988BD73|nr:FAD-binding and (Fe-S)-binding domain-containing protein [Tessaracoccus aquimaris]